MVGTCSLDLPVSPRAAVFRAMETIVRQNPVFGRVDQARPLPNLAGRPDDIKPFTFQEAPCMRWTPMNTGEQFRTPDTMSGDLLINCEVIIRGSLLRRPDELLVDAHTLLLPDRIWRPGRANMLALQSAGARSGLVLFSQPAFDPGPDGVFFAGQGQLKIEIQSQLNT